MYTVYHYLSSGHEKSYSVACLFNWWSNFSIYFFPLRSITRYSSVTHAVFAPVEYYTPDGRPSSVGERVDGRGYATAFHRVSRHEKRLHIIVVVCKCMYIYIYLSTSSLLSRSRLYQRVFPAVAPFCTCQPLTDRLGIHTHTFIYYNIRFDSAADPSFYCDNRDWRIISRIRVRTYSFFFFF